MRYWEKPRPVITDTLEAEAGGSQVYGLCFVRAPSQESTKDQCSITRTQYNNQKRNTAGGNILKGNNDPVDFLRD